MISTLSSIKLSSRITISEIQVSKKFLNGGRRDFFSKLNWIHQRATKKMVNLAIVVIITHYILVLSVVTPKFWQHYWMHPSSSVFSFCPSALPAPIPPPLIMCLQRPSEESTQENRALAIKSTSGQRKLLPCLNGIALLFLNKKKRSIQRASCKQLHYR